MIYHAPWLRKLTLVPFTIVVGVFALASPAAAHNSLMSSDPADGAILVQASARITFAFAGAVALDTMSVEVVVPDGVRTPLDDLVHGDNDTQVSAVLPTLPAGVSMIRWRLVGAHGHQVTGRIAVTMESPGTGHGRHD